MLTEPQLKERQNYIGGSDVGAILGLNPYRTPLDVYKEKALGEKEEVKNTFVYWGSKSEPIIREVFSEITGLKVTSVLTKFHKKYKFLAANIDGFIPKKNAILEIKTVGYYGRKNWGNENHDLQLINNPYSSNSDKSTGLSNKTGYIPPSYLCQCIHYAAIYEVEKVYIAVYFGNDLPLKIYLYERDLEAENALIDKLVDFWENNVLAKLPPVSEDNSYITASDHAEMVIATNEISDVYYTLKNLTINEKQLKEQIETERKKIIHFMKGNKSELLIDIDGSKLCSYKYIETNRFNNALFKQQYPDLFTKFINKSGYARLFIH